MIGEGKFRTDVAAACNLLSALDLMSYRNFYPSYNRASVEATRDAESYLGQYQQYLLHQAFDIQLHDGAILFFRRSPEDKTMLSYGYLPSPYEALPHDEFFAYLRTSEAEDPWAEYEEYQGQLPLRAHVVPLRYDWSPALYREGAHPAAHIHIGHDTDIRLAVDALLTPTQFVLFVIRHFYVAQWENRALQNEDVQRVARQITDAAIAVHYRNTLDLLELRLTSIPGKQIG